MLHPIRFLWKQFRGPQITGIMTAVYRWMKAKLDTTLDYFNTFSIETANETHLSLIGMIIGLVRPIVDFSPFSMFWFTDGGPLGNNDHGFDSIPATGFGGQFSDLQNPDTVQLHEVLPARFYRPLLKAWADYDMDGASLSFLDTVLGLIWDSVQHGVPKAYKIMILTEIDRVQNRSYGDIVIDLGPQAAWGESVTYIRGMLEGIATTLYNPLPRLFITFSGDPLEDEQGNMLYTDPDERLLEVG